MGDRSLTRADLARQPGQLAREAGCVIGRDYPEPIVDHGAARRRALARYAQAG